MKLVLLSLLLTGCGFKASGSTTHRVEGEATVRIVVDVSICDSLTGTDKVECIKTIVEVLKASQTDKEVPTSE